MLSQVFERFVEKSPVSVRGRGLLKRIVGREKLDSFFYRVANNQYTRELLFSSIRESCCFLPFPT